jgi:hypothetical protein
MRWLIRTPPGPHLHYVDHPGIFGYLARHNLRLVYRRDGKFAHAEAHLQAALAERPEYLPSRQARDTPHRQQGRTTEGLAGG